MPSIVSKAQSEVAKVLPMPTSITTIDGKTIQVPPVSLRKEALVSTELSNALKEVFGVDFSLDEGDRKNFKMSIDVIGNLLSKSPERLSSMASTLLSGPDAPVSIDWVKDNLRMKDVVQLLVPFFGETISELRLASLPLASLFGQANPTPKQ